VEHGRRPRSSWIAKNFCRHRRILCAAGTRGGLAAAVGATTRGRTVGDISGVNGPPSTAFTIIVGGAMLWIIVIGDALFTCGVNG
jgi:hypothetical protein